MTILTLLFYHIQEHDSIGTVIHVKGSGTPMVQYKGCVKSYTINPEALIKVDQSK